MTTDILLLLDPSAGKISAICNEHVQRLVGALCCRNHMHLQYDFIYTEIFAFIVNFSAQSGILSQCITVELLTFVFRSIRDTEFVSRSGNYLLWLSYFVVFFSPSRKSFHGALKDVHSHFYPYRFQFSIQKSSLPSTLPNLSNWKTLLNKPTVD